MRQALDASGGLPIRVQDPDSQQVYLLVAQPAEISLDEQYIRLGLQTALDQFARGECDDWDIEAIIADAERRYAERADG